MAALASLLVFCQALGATAGALAAVWGEIAYVGAMRDGALDAAERAHLRNIARGLRWGMPLVLISSLGLTIVAYLRGTVLQPALSAGYWTLVALALLIIAVSWALSRRRISFALGSALVFTAWWFLAYLTLGLLYPLSFGAAAAFFAVATAIFYGILAIARFFALRKE